MNYFPAVAFNFSLTFTWFADSILNEDVNFCDRYVVCNTDYSDSVNVDVPDHVFLTFAIVRDQLCVHLQRKTADLFGRYTWHMKHGSVRTLFDERGRHLCCRLR